jgi:hypothetical protein
LCTPHVHVEVNKANEIITGGKQLQLGQAPKIGLCSLQYLCDGKHTK